MLIKLLPTPFSVPELVNISVSLEELRLGPSDNRIRTVNPKDLKTPYNYPYLPPFEGESIQCKAAEEEFIKVDVNDVKYRSINIYGTVRHALDMWESYFSHSIEWWFNEYFDRLELVTQAQFNNAHAGYGFIETGISDYNGTPYALNHDVIAHELGHTVAHAKLGTLDSAEYPLIHYFGLHETIADLTALLSLLHFDSQLEQTLYSTQGNLFTLNPISRIGKLSPHCKQIRIAPNYIKMEQVRDSKNPCEFELPLLGFFYDLLAVIFQKRLLNLGLIDSKLANIASILTSASKEEIQIEFSKAYNNNHQPFKETLIYTRELLGAYLAFILDELYADQIHYKHVVNACLKADEKLTKNHHGSSIELLANWRGL